MTTAVVSPAPAPAPAPEGHCSKCHKIWTLDTDQGVCQWCGKPSSCQQQRGKSRTIKTRPRRKQVADNGNGYDQLPEPHRTYYNVASRFAYKVLIDDQADLLHDIIYHLAKVEQAQGKPLSEPAMYRTAEHVKDHYWYELRERTLGLDCQHCATAQRRKCKKDWLYPDCPKAIKLESLNKPILDSEGNLTELGELIADDKALDLDAWVDVRTFLLKAPLRLKGIAVKLRDGGTLTGAERKYLCIWRKREQIKLL